MASPGKPAGALPNPYAKALPNPYAAATVAESAPVRFSEEQAKAEQKNKTAFHNPHQIKRPQAKGTAVKKPVIARPVMAASSSDSATSSVPSMAAQQPSLEYWQSSVDDDAAALEYKREQDRLHRERKKQVKKFAKQYGHWNPSAVYKPEWPSNLRAYEASGAYREKLDDFQNFLRAQAPPVPSSKATSQPLSEAPSASSVTPEPAVTKPSFAPPANYDDDRMSDSLNVADVPNAADDEDPYVRRMRLLQQLQLTSKAQALSPPAASAPYQAAVPPPPPSQDATSHSDAPPPPPPPPPPAPAATLPVPYNPTISAPPVRYEHATISAPPVRYDVPSQPDEQLREERPAKRPKLSKAEAMMAKMGYKKGEGLGKNSDGITTHLEVKARKKERDTRNFDPSDDFDDNGKVIKAQQVFDILGGHSTKQKEPDKFGTESKVIVAWGCVDGIDWSADAERDDGGIRQEMGQTFDDKFGRVERIFVNLTGDEQTVYIKFASELSALNAVNRFSEGYQFRGRDIRARYYNERKFEDSVFDH